MGREGNGTPLQYSCLENPMGGGAWWAAICGVVKSRTWLSDFTFTFHFHALEKEMATHSSVLAWRIPGTGEPGGLPSMGSHRVRHDWSDLAAGAWVYFWAFYLDPLVYISDFVWVPYCLDECSFVVEPEVRQVDSSSSILFSQDCFGYSRFFVFPYKLWNYLF